MSIIQPKKLLTVPSGSLRIPRLPLEADIMNESILFSLVIPTYLEAGNINKIVRTLTSLLDENIPGDYELIIVDDNSPDGTWEVAFSMMSEFPQLRVMRRENERGLSSAVIRGWQNARGRVLGVIDGDLQHPPHILLQLLKAIEKYDLAVASRHVEGGGVSSWSFMRRLLSRGAQMLGLLILPQVTGKVSDPMSGYFMVRRNCVENITFNPIGYKILLEVLGRGRVKGIAEVGYVFCERQDGESKVSWKHYLDYIRHLLRLRFSSEAVEKLSQRWNFPIGRFIRFGLVGLSGVFVDMTILYLLSDPNTLALPLTRSKIIAGEIAIFNNFLWNDAWTFADVAVQQKGLKQRLKRFLKFNIICLAGLVINVLVLNLIFNFVISNRYIANLIAIAVATVWNFWVNLKLSWRVTQVK
ncbi:MAG: glycosyltransferase [Nostocales cyanobacterium 94392]|nr:glycosyltransferase [Nostocales cyanobacterium 94392]